MTDDATVPLDSSPPAEPGSAGPSSTEDDPNRKAPTKRRRRWLIGAGVAGAVVVVILACVAFGTAFGVTGYLVRRADSARAEHARVDSACLALERRLNRLTPPGATETPRQRATAVRHENAAVQPFLAEIERLADRSRDDDGDDRDDDDTPKRRQRWADGWRQLIDARTTYANALDQQARAGEPAFFLLDQDRRGRTVLDRLLDGPQSCAGPSRRLAAPDL
ncbi:hypothetical protein [Micromonospora sonneratiae]|uniref:LemA protein n=1 Tax=Micromonospora sonneratiae TaxID=1184706 RepID=A0ABW3YNR2_9ACTN